MSGMRGDRMAEKSICVKGYAKINLYLDVTEKMEDGNHRVETVMQTVSICDDVTLSLKENNGFSLRCNVSGVPTDGTNLALRAAKLYCEATGVPEHLHVKIEKRIPMAAGMAGGSADAAAVLVGMNRLYGTLLSPEQLCALGRRLGADVPFCIVGGTAYADGRGDVLHPFPSLPSCALVIACEGEGVSTPWAYGLLDQQYHDFEEPVRHGALQQLKKAAEQGDLLEIARNTYNIFEEPVLAERPVAAEIRCLLLEHGALGAMMSGSGPSVFGIFETDAQAEMAMRALAERGYTPYLCYPVTLAK